MKIYAVADIHGKPGRFRRIRENALSVGAKRIVMAGDIGGLFSQKQSARQMAALPVPVLAVRGNSDRRRIETDWWGGPEVTSLHMKKTTVEGCCLAGISGTSLLPFESRLRLREKKFQKEIGSFFAGVHILVTHPPPRGVLDRVFGRFHAGSSALREIVLRFQPEVLLCGHIHECPGTDFLGETLVVNCSLGRSGEGALIEWVDSERPTVRFL